MRGVPGTIVIIDLKLLFKSGSILLNILGSIFNDYNKCINK